MNRISKLILLLPILYSCQWGVNDDCKKNYNSAVASLDYYYNDSNFKHLDTALGIVEKSHRVCPDDNFKWASLKISLLMIKKEYERGYKFVDSLEDKQFNNSYKKKMSLLTFKALHHEKQGDTTKRNEYFEDIISEIKIYINKNPTDKNAILDLYYTKLQYIAKIEVIAEIDSVIKKSNDVNEKEFYETLKETISLTNSASHHINR